MRTLARKAALLIGATAAAGSALAAVPTTAYAQQGIPPISTPLPYCVQADDTAGRVAQLCINSISTASVPGSADSVAVTASGSIKACTSTYSCVPEPITLSTTGVGLNPNDAYPQITYMGSETVSLPTVCVSTTCTPGTVSVPLYNVTLFPPGYGPLTTVCVDGICSVSPLAPVAVTDLANAAVGALVQSTG